MKVLEPKSNSNTRPEIPSETLVINELIREFLTWNGYLYTTSVLVSGKVLPLLNNFVIGDFEARFNK
jgi:hypothetical protein